MAAVKRGTKRKVYTQAEIKTLRKGPKYSESDQIVLAAVFARSNMGQGLPEKSLVDYLRKPGEGRHRQVTLDSAVVTLCQQFMECDDHYSMFMDEARGWQKELAKNSIAYVTAIHPDIAALFAEPVP